MIASAPTDEGFPVRCELCGKNSSVDVSRPPGDSVCPHCGSLLWVMAVAELTGEYGFSPDAVINELVGTTQQSVFREMAEVFSSRFEIEEKEYERICKQLEEYESWGTTAVGNGVAIPHVNSEALDRCFTVMAHSSRGIEFNTPDDTPVHTLVMVAAPPTLQGDFLRKLECIATAMRFLRSK